MTVVTFEPGFRRVARAFITRRQSVPMGATPARAGPARLCTTARLPAPGRAQPPPPPPPPWAKGVWGSEEEGGVAFPERPAAASAAAAAAVVAIRGERRGRPAGFLCGTLLPPPPSLPKLPQEPVRIRRGRGPGMPAAPEAPAQSRLWSAAATSPKNAHTRTYAFTH